MKRGQQVGGEVGPLLVPEIDNLELVVGFALQQFSVGPRARIRASPSFLSPPGSINRNRSIFAAAGATSA